MNLFKLKRPRWLGWRFGLYTLLVIMMMAIIIRQPCVKTWLRIQFAKHGFIPTRELAIFFLGIEGDDPKVVVPVLISCLEDKDDAIRETAALSLGHIRQYPEQVVPALLTALNKAKSPRDMSGFYIVRALSQYGTNARPWSPIFYQMIQSNSFNCAFANPLFVLRTIDPEVGGPLVEQYLAGVSNRLKQAELDNAEKQRRKALAATNPPPAKP